MPSVDALLDLKADLVRKALKGAVLAGKMSATIPVKFTTGASADLVDLSTSGLKSLGHIAKDAPPTFTPEVAKSAVEAWGVIEEIREDIIKRSLSVGYTPIETNKSVLEMYEGIDLSAVEADATTSEVQFSASTSPDTKYYRTVFLAIDGSGADAVYFGRVLPRATVSEVSAQNWNPDSAVTYPMTLGAKVDPILGYASRLFFGGPGWKAIAARAGFTVAAGG